MFRLIDCLMESLNELQEALKEAARIRRGAKDALRDEERLAKEEGREEDDMVLEEGQEEHYEPRLVRACKNVLLMELRCSTN